MSLDTARNSIEDYKDEYFSVVFVDEVHKVKNPKAQLTRALKQLGACRLLVHLNHPHTDDIAARVWVP